jgi:hypothetical protein
MGMHLPGNRTSMSLLCAAACAGSILTTGCQSAQRLPQGRGAIVAAYKFSTLSAVLPDAARVPGVMAASEATLRQRGYAIDSMVVTEEQGSIVARPPTPLHPGSEWPRVQVLAKRLWNGTRVQIEVQPLGDQGASRVILDGILQMLDL